MPSISEIVKPDAGGVANPAVVLENIDNIKVREFGLPEGDLGPTDVLVAVKKVGICGSDVHYWKHGRIGDFICEFDKRPMILGHESSGEVVAVGKDVTDLKAGDRITMEPGVPTDFDNPQYNLDPDIAFFATPPIDGSLRKYLVHPRRWVYKLPDNVSLEEGAMCEPLSVGVYACGPEKGRVKDGDSVLVLGAGPIGTLCTLVALGKGAKTVIVNDIDEKRLKFLQDLAGGPSKVVYYVTQKGDDAMAIASKVKELNGGKHVECTIDCCAVETAIGAGILATKAGGKVVLVGMGKPNMTLPLLNASCREVDLLGVFRYRFTYPTCLEMLSEKKIDVNKLITHKFAFNQESVMSAFEHCATGKDGCIKAMIEL